MPEAIAVRLDEETLTALDRLAAQEHSTRDALLNEAVRDYVAVHDRQLERIRDGLAAADRGEFAAASEVQRVRHKFSGG